MKEKNLRSYFQRFGKIDEVNVPMKTEGLNTLNRGFAFVEFAEKEIAQKAIDELHNQKWKGRTLALEFSVPKGTYEGKVTNLMENTKMERKDAVLPKNLRDEFKAVEDAKAKAEQEKKEYEEKNRAKIRK